MQMQYPRHHETSNPLEAREEAAIEMEAPQTIAFWVSPMGVLFVHENCPAVGALKGWAAPLFRACAAKAQREQCAKS